MKELIAATAIFAYLLGVAQGTLQMRERYLVPAAQTGSTQP